MARTELGNGARLDVDVVDPEKGHRDWQWEAEMLQRDRELRSRSDDGERQAATGWVYQPGRGRLVHLRPGHTRELLNYPVFCYWRLMRNSVGWPLDR